MKKCSPKIFPPFEHVAVHTLLLILLIVHATVTFESLTVGISGSHPMHPAGIFFQKNPLVRFHRHFVRRRPLPTFPHIEFIKCSIEKIISYVIFLNNSSLVDKLTYMWKHCIHNCPHHREQLTPDIN